MTGQLNEGFYQLLGKSWSSCDSGLKAIPPWPGTLLFLPVEILHLGVGAGIKITLFPQVPGMGLL